MGNPRRPARVLYVQYTNPGAYPPVDHSAELFAEAGFEVLVLGTRSLNDPLELTGHPRVRVETMRAEPGGWRQKVHYARFAAWALLWTARWRPQWVYASDPPACPASSRPSGFPRSSPTLVLTWIASAIFLSGKYIMSVR
jgi:hypothetical protein